jgi:hypothetical protein
MLNGFELLGLNENATPEDVQSSFAYLYQMIDLIYPIGKDENTKKIRYEELKKLENSYFSALKSIRNEVIKSSNSLFYKTHSAIFEIEKIERQLNQTNNISFKENISICDEIMKAKNFHKLENYSVKGIKYPTLFINERYYRITELSEHQIGISPVISDTYGNTVKGILHFTSTTSIDIIGKIIKKEKSHVLVRLVTRIAKKLVDDFNTK